MEGTCTKKNTRVHINSACTLFSGNLQTLFSVGKE